MIRTPKLSHLPYTTLFLSGVGYGLARFEGMNAKLTTSILAVSSIANYILFIIGTAFLKNKNNFKAEKVYVATNSVTVTASLFALNYFELLSRRMLVVGLFCNLGLLAVRLKYLSDNNAWK